MNMKLLETIAIAAVLGLAIAGCSSKTDTAQTETPTPRTNTSSDGTQQATITIEGGKYNPSVVSVEKGKPVELTFAGGKELGCGGTVVFKSLNMSKDVESGKTVTFNFTPKEAGEIAFTCGMGMYDGKVVVK
jgi:plastocyanin domain-containing protein